MEPIPPVGSVGFGSVCLEKLSASCWLMVEVAWMYCTSGNRPVAHTRSPSSKSNGRSVTGCSSSDWLEASSVISGKGLVLQVLMLASSFFRFRLSVRTLSLHPMQQRGRHRVISTFPVLQSILGLCSLSQVIPRIRFCLPRPVTANKARSECFSYRTISSTTSDMQPASFGVLSTLKTGITLESFFVRS